jgi:uncharacterized protein DUF4861
MRARRSGTHPRQARVQRTAVLTGLVALLATTAPVAEVSVWQATVRNDLDLSRPGETIELSRTALGSLPPDDLLKLSVQDTTSGKDVLAQAVDTDGDYNPDRLVFQSDFAPRQSRTFTVKKGERRLPKKEDFRVYGRFVRERFDDFAWENDKVAHRMYGAALETWEREPLTSSAVDVWVKRTPRLIVNDWYMVDDYHRDLGEGADLYSAGPSRGCGGSGLWKEGRLFVSKNFRGSRVLANGPVRLVFELTYLPWDVGGQKVSEVKRITLDAGSHFNRFESTYTVEGSPAPDGAGLTWAAGIKKANGSVARVEREAGWVRTWEPIQNGASGNLGCGIVVDPKQVTDVVESGGNHLVIGKSPAGSPATYYAGSGWDRGGDLATMADWDRQLQELARRLGSALKVEVAAR